MGNCFFIFLFSSDIFLISRFLFFYVNRSSVHVCCVDFTNCSTKKKGGKLINMNEKN